MKKIYDIYTNPMNNKPIQLWYYEISDKAWDYYKNTKDKSGHKIPIQPKDYKNIKLIKQLEPNPLQIEPENEENYIEHLERITGKNKGNLFLLIFGDDEGLMAKGWWQQQDIGDVPPI